MSYDNLREIRELTDVKEVNELLRMNWVIIEVFHKIKPCPSPDGGLISRPLYIMGRGYP